MRPAIVSVLAVSALAAQAAKFEVASVKPSVWRPDAGGDRSRAGGGCPTSLQMDGARVEFHCATLAMLIGYAYRFSPDRVAGPDWMMAPSSPRFDIAAKLPEGTSKTEVPEMVQDLLADRFQLVIHRGSTAKPVLALVVAKGGLRLARAAPAPPVDSDPQTATGALGFFGDVHDRTAGDATILSGPRMGTVRQTGRPNRTQRWDAANISLSGLADLLDKVAPVSLPIVDATGVTGRYRMVLEISLAPSSSPEDLEPGVLTAFNDGLRKLGLRLERRRGPLETIFIDHVAMTPAAN